MELIKLSQSEKTPYVLFDSDKRVFDIEGNSRPENVRDFFFPILEKIKDFFNSVLLENKIKDFNDKPFNFNFKLGYFNSSTAKYISDLLVIVADFKTKGLDLRVYWFYEEGDEDMRDAGNDFSQLLDFQFNYVMIKHN